jgi:hopanoid biosynthesis associated RND transporter like protein HpnN
VIVLATIAGKYTVENLSINTDTAELIAPEARFQQNRRKFEKAFSQDMHTLLLVVESDTPELTKSATKRLGRLLGADKDNFVSVYIPNENEFFRRNGLLYLESSDLYTISANLAQAQPFIGRISEQPNLSGFLSILEDALKTTNQDQSVPIDLPALIEKVSKTLHKSINGENALLSWEELIAEKELSVSRTQNGFIIVLPKFNYSRIRPAAHAIESIRKKVAEIQDPNLPSVKVWVTGEVGLEDDELMGMSTGTFTASIFSIVLVLFILLVAYRSIILSLATLISISLGMLFCGAFAAFAVQKLNLISVAFAVSNVGLGVEYAIHLCLRYRDYLLHHIDNEKSIEGTILSTSPSLLLCAGTTAIGLYSFIPTDYKGVSELGLLAGTSLFICLIVTLITLPALLKIIPVSYQQSDKNYSAQDIGVLGKIAKKMAAFTLHNAKLITLLTMILAVISIYLVTNVKTDFNPINLRDPNTESVIAFKNLMKDKETSPMTLTVLTKDEKETKALQQKVSAIDSVDKSISFFDFMPSDQEEKLAIIEDMAMVLGTQAKKFPTLIQDNDPNTGINKLINALNDIIPTKTDAKEIETLIGFRKELQDIQLEITSRQEPSRRQFIEKIQTTLIGTLPNAMNELFDSFNAREVTLADIPADIKDRWLSKDGWYRVQIFPKKDLNNLPDLQEFITDVQAVAPDTTDLPIMYWESMKEVLAAFQKAIIIALITITLLLSVIRRNVTDVVLVMTPLILAGLFTMASTVLSNTPINFANIIALPLLLGLGVDNGIHMVEKLHHSLSDEQNIYQSSTARAMFYGALTTTSSFLGLAFSPHQGIASMGLVITLGIFWIMVSTFIILPALGKIVLKSKHKGS